MKSLLSGKEPFKVFAFWVTLVTGIFHCSNIVSDVKSFPLFALFCFHIAWKHHLCLRAAPEEETVPLFNLNDSFGEVLETTVWSRINICQRLKEKKKNRAKILLTLKISFANYVNTADCMLKVAVFARINLDMLISKHTGLKNSWVCGHEWKQTLCDIWFYFYVYVFVYCEGTNWDFVQTMRRFLSGELTKRRISVSVHHTFKQWIKRQ